MMGDTFGAALKNLERSGQQPDRFSASFVEFLPVTGAAVSTLGRVLGNETVSATDERAARLDELQFDLGEGPCWDALRTARPVHEPSMQTDGRRRWPAFASAAHLEDVRSLFAFPLIVGPLRLGAVDLYSDEPTTLAADHEQKATALADVVGRLILRRALDEHELSAEDQHPLSRRVVHQASGVVLAQLDLSPDDALLIIQGQAFATARPVSEVAEDIVSGRLRFRRLMDGIEVEST
ncbi:MAG: GAF and ANTAR domain-containing protein [Microbacterium sp.]